MNVGLLLLDWGVLVSLGELGVEEEDEEEEEEEEDGTLSLDSLSPRAFDEKYLER